MTRPRIIKNPKRFLLTIENDTHQALIRLAVAKSLKVRRNITLSGYVRELLNQEAGITHHSSEPDPSAPRYSRHLNNDTTIAERHLYDAVLDAIIPLAKKIEDGHENIDKYEPDVVMDLTDAYEEALQMAGIINSDELSSAAHSDTIWDAVYHAFMELSSQDELEISPDVTIDILADELIQRLQLDVNQQAQSRAG